MKKKFLALLLCTGMFAEVAIPLSANDPSNIIVESDYGGTENSISVETNSEETSVQDYFDISNSIDFASGDGSENNPYVIINAEQLTLLSELVNNGMLDSDGSLYASKSYVLEADITLNDDSVFTYGDNNRITGIAAEDAGIHWTPIGNYSSYALVQEAITADNFDTVLSKYHVDRLYCFNGTYYFSVTSYDKSYEEYYFTPSFTGNFDGKGQTIRGLLINNTDNYSGLFGYSNSDLSTIKNINIVNLYVAGDTNVGAIIGYASQSTIDNCYAEGLVTGDSSIGGIVGSIEQSIVKNCNNETDIIVGIGGIAGGITGFNHSSIVENCNNSGRISIHKEDEKGSYRSYIGGIVGYNRNGEVRSCYNIGALFSNSTLDFDEIGGIVGESTYGRIYDCYNTGSIYSSSSNSVIGGIVGQMYGTINYSCVTKFCYTIGEIVKCNTDLDCAIGAWNSFDGYGKIIKSVYILDSAAENDITVGGELLTESQLRQKDSYSDFDFETVWEIGVTEGYPYPTLRDNPHSGSNKPTPSENDLVGKTFTQSTLRALGYDTIPADYAVGEYPPFLQFTNENSGIFYIVNSEFGYPVNFTYNLAGDLITITPSDAGDYAEGRFGQATELVMQMTENGNLKVKSYSPEPTDTNNYAIGWTTYDDIFLLKDIPSVKPTVSNMPSDYQINLGESFDLSNVTVTAGNGGKLNKVTLKHNLTGTTFVPSSILVAYQSSSVTLGDNFVLSGDQYPLNTVGTHEFIIYASADNYTVADNQIATFTVTVVESTDEAINAKIVCTDPEDYAGNYRDFTVYFDSFPTSAYLQFDNQHDPNQWLSDEYCSSNPTFIIDTAKIVETSDGYQYETTFIIHSEGLARNNYARKVRVAIPTVDGVKYSEPFTFYVIPIPEHPQNTIGIAYEQTLDISDDTELPAITAVIANNKGAYYRLTVANYTYDDNASIFFYWETDSGEFQRVNDDYTVVDFIPDGENKVTVYMGDGLGYVASYTLTINK